LICKKQTTEGCYAFYPSFPLPPPKAEKTHQVIDMKQREEGMGWKVKETKK